MMLESSLLQRISSTLRTAGWRDWWSVGAVLLQIWMEGVWISLWVVTFFRLDLSIRPAPAYLVFSLILTGSWLLVNLMDLVGARLIFRRGLFLLYTYICISIAQYFLLYSDDRFNLLTPFSRPIAFLTSQPAYPLEFWLIIVVILITLRGLFLPHFQGRVDGMVRSFRLGIFMLLSFAIFQTDPSVPGALPHAGLFLLLGLSALSAARLADLDREITSGSKPDTREWLLIIAGNTIASLLILSLVAILLIWQAETVRTVVSYLVTGALGLLLIPTIVLAILVVLALSPLIKTIDLSFFNNLLEIQRQLQMLSRDQGTTNLTGVNNILRPVLMVGGLLILVLIGVNLYRNRGKAITRNLETRDIGENAEDRPVFQAGWLSRGLNALINAINPRRLRDPRRIWAAARVRRAYRRLMDLANAIDCPRPAACTPTEFLPTLSNKLPTVVEELSIITRQYEIVRYGELPESFTDVNEVLGCLRRIEQAIHYLPKPDAIKKMTA